VLVAAFVFRGAIFKSSPTETTVVSNAVNNVPSTPLNPVPVSPVATAPVPAGDIALGKPATASSEETAKGNLIRNGNDGDAATRWCASSGDLPQWWAVDLGDSVTVTNAQIMWERNAAYQYVIEVSTNQTNWTVVADKSGNTALIQASSDNFSAKGRYMRVVITGLPGGAWASFFEFQVFGPSDSKK
jgi:alpha-L-fucosidase